MKSSSRWWALAVVVPLVTAILSPVASAGEPSSADKDLAREAFAEGKELRAKKKYKASLLKFKSAYELVPSPITLLEYGKALVLVGQLIEARAICLKAAAMPPKPEESTQAKAARVEAGTLAEDLRARIPSLVVKVAGGEAQVSVLVDGRLVGEAPVKIEANPGPHQIVAKLKGSPDQTADVELEEGEAREVVLKFAVAAEATTAPGQGRIWVGGDIQIDAVMLGADRDLCKQSTWGCHVDGVDVGVPPDQGITVRPGDNTGGKTDSATRIGTKRLLFSLDYFVAKNISLGGRLGYIWGGNPTTVASFFPLHLEFRAQYFFMSGSFRPLGMAAGGFGRTEAGITDVVVTPNDPAQANDTVNGEPVVKGVTAYKLGGPYFTAFGVGAWIFASEDVAISLIPLKVTFALPTYVMAFSPEFGLKIAL
jgi:hypothetical protein